MELYMNKNILSCLFVVSLILSSTICLGETLGNMKGKWAFDDLNPKKTKCLQINESLVKKYSKTTTCSKSEHGGYSETDKSTVFVCKGKGFNRMILDSEKICQDNLDTENANGD